MIIVISTKATLTAQCAELAAENQLFSSGSLSTTQEAPTYVEKMHVTMRFKIPGNATNLEYDLRIPKESTINQAVEAVAKVEHGLVCCDSRDIKSINGIANDPYRQTWWTIRVNGNQQNYSSHSHLLPGDVVELAYGPGPVSHLQLRDWLLSFSKGK